MKGGDSVNIVNFSDYKQSKELNLGMEDKHSFFTAFGIVVGTLAEESGSGEAFIIDNAVIYPLGNLGNPLNIPSITLEKAHIIAISGYFEIAVQKEPLHHTP